MTKQVEEQQEDNIVEGKVTDITTVPVSHIADYVPSFAIKLSEAAERYKQFKEFVKSQMEEGEDFGTVPGIEKPTLFKPGAEKLCNIFGFAPRFEEVRTIEDWEQGFFYYCYKCIIYNKRTGQMEADCTGSANSKEDRYRWRYLDRMCPQCGQPTVIKGKEEYGGGWVCWAKRGGCGTKFEDGDESIEKQEAQKIENPDPYTLVNTLQKMGQKRALVGATLLATRASGFFTQDVEDMEEPLEARTPAPKATTNNMPFGKHKGKTIEQIHNEDPQYVTWAAENMDNKEWQQRFAEFLAGLTEVKSEEGDYIVVDGKRYNKTDKIVQKWFERLVRLQKESGMVQTHLVNHLKKHYGVERIADLNFEQAEEFGKHLKELVAQKEQPEEDENEDYEPYSLSQDVMDWGNSFEDWDFGTWYTTHVVQVIPPNMPVKGEIEEAIKQFLTKLEEGETIEAMSKAFDTRLKEILDEGQGS